MGKSQITIFIIIGIFFLVVIFFFLYLVEDFNQKTLNKNPPLDNNKREIVNYVNECISSTLSKGLEDLGFVDVEILEEYIDTNINGCIGNFNFLRNKHWELNVKENYIGASITKFKKKNDPSIYGLVEVEYLLEFSYDKSSLKLHRFEVTEPLLQDDFNISLIEFLPLHRDVANFDLVFDLDVSTPGNVINYEQDGTSTWDEIIDIGGVEVVANPYIIFKHNGKWYGSSHEWMRPNQKTKFLCSVNGHHMFAKDFIDSSYSEWVPTKEETYYFMVTSLSRLGAGETYSQRTKVKRFIWDKDTSNCINYEG